MMEVREHTCDVVKVKLETHPNADSLSLVHVGDFQCVVKTENWKDGDLAVYIPPDSVVPETKEFEFLGNHRRIKAKKLRGKWSVGLLIPAKPGDKVGDDCMERLGIIHYEPQIHGHFTTGGDNVMPPPGFFPKYDVFNFRKYSQLFQDGEEVITTEKLHGASCRFTCINDIMYCGSRNFWKYEDPKNLWWKALSNCPVLDAWLRHHQDLAVYGEVFGNVQNLKYGATNGQIYFAAFDILRGDTWLDFDEARGIGAPLPWVPLVFRGKFDKAQILELAEGDSKWPGASHYLEGVVVKPVHERTDKEIGRLQLKIVGNRYLSKS
jgi:RNA ligase (TIGR02306 family)